MIEENDNFKIATYSVDKQLDSTKRFRLYINKININLYYWVFLSNTNDKPIYKLGMEDYYLSIKKDNYSLDNFFHSTKLTIIL